INPNHKHKKTANISTSYLASLINIKIIRQNNNKPQETISIILLSPINKMQTMLKRAQIDIIEVDL
ncbi:hypothetical protein, partial [Helicobacter typhlonius]|uniref:hypothetical protein n=1 Tax=Helicobacter typhlonius TaxID=76936 RepID=UPI002FE0E152